MNPNQTSEAGRLLLVSTGELLEALFGDALRVSHTRLARFLGVRPATLRAYGDRLRIRFHESASRRRTYTREFVADFLARADEPAMAQAADTSPPVFKPRRQTTGNAALADFQAKIAARRQAQR